MNKASKRFAIGTLVAAVAGFTAGILTAPKSGKETRQDIKKAAVDSTIEAEKALKRLHTELTQLIDLATEKGTELKGRSKEQLDAMIEKSNVAKAKAREILSAIHEGDAEDKDLKRVVKDTNSAVKHLKSYLSK